MRTAAGQTVADFQDEPTRRHAHFLHRPKALEHLMALPVPHPRVLAWGSSLWVGTQSGEIWSVETDGGSRPWGEGLPEPVALAVDGSRLAQVARDGRMRIWEEEEKQVDLNLGLIGQVVLLPTPSGWVLSGDDADGQRQLRVVDLEGSTRLRAWLPARSAVAVDAEGVPLVIRSLESGLWKGRIGEVVPEGQVTSHVLRGIGADRIVGLGHGGVLFQEGEQLRSLRVADACAVAWGVGNQIALGIRRGELLALHLGSRDPLRPISGHKGPVTSLSFAPKGNFLVSAALDGCRLWGLG